MEKIQNKLMPALVILLIIAAFFLGSMYSKVKMLEKGTVSGTNVANNANDNNEPQVEPTPGPVNIDIAGLPVLGNKDAKVMIVEFTDYQCPFCKKLVDEALAQVKKEYITTNKVKYTVKNFPLTQIHPFAQKAAEAVECANEQGKLFEYHDVLFANNEKLTVDDLKKYATDLGLNTANFNSCLDTGKMVDKVKKDTDLAISVGVRGTPSTFVGTVNGNTFTGTEISGAAPFETYKSALDKALE